MTFTRIKLHGWATNEKVTSPQLNQLDIDHSKSVDKTGDNAGNAGGISGEIDVLSGGQVKFLSGSNLNLQAGATATLVSGSSITGNVVFADSQNPEITQVSTSSSANNITIAAQTTTQTSAQGGGLNLNAGNGVGTSGRGGVVAISAGTGSSANGSIELFTSASEVSLSDSLVNVVINGLSILQGGSSSTSFYPITGGQSFVVQPFVGTQDSNQPQRGNYGILHYWTTIVAGSPIPLGSGLFLGNNSVANIEISWVCRDDAASGRNFYAGNKALVMAHCNSSGVVSAVLNSGSNYLAPSSYGSGTIGLGGFGDTSIFFSLSASTNNLTISAVQAPSTIVTFGGGSSFEANLQTTLTVSIS